MTVPFASQDTEASRLEAKSKPVGRVRQLLSGNGIALGQIAVVALILFAVQYAVDSGAVKRIYLASPTQILEAFPKLVFQENLFYHLGVTLSEALVGMSIGAVLGISTGIYMGLFPRINQFLGPFLVWTMAVPKVTIIPLMTLYLGIGYTHKVVIVFLFSYFLFVFNTIAGIKGVQDNHVKVARTLGASQGQIIRKVILPSAIPSIMAAVRIEAATMLVAALFAEIIASKAGLGNLLNRLTGVYDTAGVFALVILITTISLCIIFLVELLERRVFLKWKYA